MRFAIWAPVLGLFLGKMMTAGKECTSVIPNRFIVTLKRGISQTERQSVVQLVKDLGAKLGEEFSLIGAFVVDDLRGEETFHALKDCPFVEAIEADAIVKALDEL